MIEKGKKKQPNDFIKYSGMATQMAITILAGVFGGQKLDAHLEMEAPVFTITGSLLGVGAALYFLIKDFIRK
ncbi:AtpZ/AtpI family protein [bacterium]|nr:AtpZ/AtpI family protein [bacterium]